MSEHVLNSNCKALFKKSTILNAIKDTTDGEAIASEYGWNSDTYKEPEESPNDDNAFEEKFSDD